VPTFASGLLRLGFLVVVGIGLGLVIAEIVHRVEHHVDHAPIEIALSILTPYVAYLAADFVHASGVLAVVACGLYLSRKSSHFFSPTVRLQASAVWDSLTFILNGLVFVLIGLQLPYVVGTIRDHNLGILILYGLAFSAFLIVLRIAWMFPGAHLGTMIRKRILHQHERVPPARNIFVLGWTGMRGVVSLAAAIALPQTLANGAPFGQRDMIIFLAFCVILVTLVLQGLTLPPLIRALGVARTSETNTEAREVRRAILQSALDYLNSSKTGDDSELAEIYDDLAHDYRRRLDIVSEDKGKEGAGRTTPAESRYIDIACRLVAVERQTALRLRNRGLMSDDLLREIERELDLLESELIARAA
jgi:CPA1 family monovalent cation:H+ antiporter